MKMNKPAKYAFLTDEEYRTCDAYISSAFITQTKSDCENYTQGVPKKEIAKCRLSVKFIVGLEHNNILFNNIYGAEYARDKENRPFWEQLDRYLKDVPKETFFRYVPPVGGYWKIRDRVDLLNLDHIDDDVLANDSDNRKDAFTFELEQAKKTFSENVHNIDALIKVISMEEEMCRRNVGSFSSSNPAALAERHQEMVKKAIKADGRNAKLRLMKIELLIKMDPNSPTIIDDFKNLTITFPHEPMVWIKYLDYIQYDSNVYNYKKLKNAFEDCIRQVTGLTNGTLLSHLNAVNDRPLLRMFHLWIYIRYLKWMISCAHTPVVLANIQATFEYNFGLADVEKRTSTNSKEREVRLEEFWESGLPRIGDEGAVGAEKMLKQSEELSDEDIQKLENDDFDILISRTEETIATCLQAQRDVQISWIEVEREMMNIDARVKRTKLKDCELYEDHVDDLETCELWDIIPFDRIRYYEAPGDCANFDFVQPFLELLGVKFLNSTNCFTTTEQIISDWISNDSTVNFYKTPTYTEKKCFEVGNNILKFMLYNRLKLTENNPEYLDKTMVKYLLAMLVTEASEQEKKLNFHSFKLNLKNLVGTFITKHPDIFKRAMLSKITGIVYMEKFVSWWERALKEQEKVVEADERRKNYKEIKMEEGVVDDVKFDVILLKKDKERVQTIRDKIRDMIDIAIPKSTEKLIQSADSSLPTLQLHLYANVLRGRLSILNQNALEETRDVFCKEILGIHTSEFESDEALLLALDQGLNELLEHCKEKDNLESVDSIPELPRAEALCEALKVVAVFVFLDKMAFSRRAVDCLIANAITKFEQFEAKKNDFNRGTYEKYCDQIDLKFITDTLITFFSHKKHRFIYNENFKKLIFQASQAFPCDSKYAKMLGELHSSGRLQVMKLQGFTDSRNSILNAKRDQQFDPELETRLLMNSLTIMFSWMNAANRIGDAGNQILYKNWKREAANTRDPAIWRQVIRVASKLSQKILKDDAYTRARGQCTWALNLHFDYIEAKTVRKNGDLMEMIYLILEQSMGQEHSLFVTDEEYMKTQQEIGLQYSESGR